MKTIISDKGNYTTGYCFGAVTFCCSLHFPNRDILIEIIIDWGVRLLPC